MTSQEEIDVAKPVKSFFLNWKKAQVFRATVSSTYGIPIVEVGGSEKNHWIIISSWIALDSSDINRYAMLKKPWLKTLEGEGESCLLKLYQCIYHNCREHFFHEKSFFPIIYVWNITLGLLLCSLQHGRFHICINKYLS